MIIKTPLKCLNYIDGEWIPAQSQANQTSRNPADWREIVGTYPTSGPADVDTAVQAARRAYPIWRKVPAPSRAELIYDVAQLLIEHKEQLAYLMSQEMGKPIAESRNEVQEGINSALYYAGEGRRLFGQTTPSEFNDKFVMTMRIPIGVCALITPWNFPIASPCAKLFPALVCGNSIIIKPARDTSVCTTVLFQIFHEVGFPPGVVNLVNGFGESVGRALMEHSGIDLISFTGSSNTGSQIGAVCGRTHKRVSLEMGGKNSQLVMEDADLNLAVEGAVWGAFSTSGQRCTATSRLILHRDIKAEFTKRLLYKVSKLRLGPGTDPKTDIGPLVNLSQIDRVTKYLKIGISEGAKILIGGDVATDDNLKNGYFIQPTVLDQVTPDMRIAQEEIFGPVLVLLEVDSFEEGIKIINDSPYGLSASVYTKNINRALLAIRDIDSGMTYINAPTIGSEIHLPFGGFRQTGNGHRESGNAVLEVFTEWKTVYVDFSESLQKSSSREIK